MMTDLPAELVFGKVVGRFLLAVVDSSDSGSMPDKQAAVGSVLFTPRWHNMDVLAPPAIVSSTPTSCTLDENGYIVDDQGNRGVWLVAGVYDVSFLLRKVRISPIAIQIIEEYTEMDPLDLTQEIPTDGQQLSGGQYSRLSRQLAAIYAGLAGKSDLSHSHPGGGGGGGVGGVSDHNDLTGREAADQHPLGAITGLVAALGGKATTAHSHVGTDITNLAALLGAKSDTTHTHDASQIQGLDSAIDTRVAAAVQPPSYIPIGWDFLNTDFFAGATGIPVRVPCDGTLDEGPFIITDDYGSGDLVVDVTVQHSGQAASSVYNTTKATLPTGQTSIVAATPVRQSVVKGDLISASLVGVPPAGVTGATPAVVGSGTTTGNMRTDLNSNTITLTIPTGLTTADAVIAAITGPSSLTITTVPADWVLLGSQASATTHLKTYIYAAQYRATLDGHFVCTPAALTVAVVVPVTHCTVTDLNQIVWAVAPEGTLSTSADPMTSSPSFTAQADYDDVLYFCSTRFPPPVNYWRTTWNTGATELAGADALTYSYDSTTFTEKIDFGLSVAKKGSAVANAGVVTPVTVKLTHTPPASEAPVASTTVTAMVGMLGIKRGPASHAPSQVSVQLYVKV